MSIMVGMDENMSFRAGVAEDAAPSSTEDVRVKDTVNIVVVFPSSGVNGHLRVVMLTMLKSRREEFMQTLDRFRLDL